MHSHADAKKLTVALNRFSTGLNPGFQAGGRRIALRASAGVRATDVMVNRLFLYAIYPKEIIFYDDSRSVFCGNAVLSYGATVFTVLQVMYSFMI